MNKTDEALHLIVVYNGHRDWLLELAKLLDKNVGKSYVTVTPWDLVKRPKVPKDVIEHDSESHMIFAMLVAMFGDWGTSVNSGWISQPEECANYIRNSLCWSYED